MADVSEQMAEYINALAVEWIREDQSGPWLDRARELIALWEKEATDDQVARLTGKSRDDV